MNVLGNGVALDPENLWKEMQEVMGQGIALTPDNLKISDRASLLLPWHRDLDELEERRLKDKKYGLIEEEIRCLKKACGDKILKVIIETCLLTEEEKVKMCEIVTEAGADYIKTSTGFSKAGATFEDIALFAEHIGPGVKMKAAGGISSLEDVERFLSLGSDRLGTSRIIKLVKNEEASGY